MANNGNNSRRATIGFSFPTESETSSKSPLDLNELLIVKPHATFFIRAKGNSMNRAGVFENDLVIVDRSQTPANGQVVVAALNGELTLKRYLKSYKGCFLAAENPAYPTLPITEDMDFEVWGVATYVIHNLLRDKD